MTAPAQDDLAQALSALQAVCDAETRRIHTTGVDCVHNFPEHIELLRKSHAVLRAASSEVLPAPHLGIS